MKNDLTTTILNLVLAAFVMLAALFAWLSMSRARELSRLNATVSIANNTLLSARSLVADVTAYNATAKSPELTRIIQTTQAKNAALPKPVVH